MREKILKYIEKNGRFDLAALADKVGADESAVAGELAAMEKEGIICGYHTLINWEKVSNTTVTALIEVRVTPQKEKGFNRLARMIYEFPEVDSIYLISGGYDFLVIIEGMTLREAAHFVNEQLAVMDGIISTATHFVLKKYKDHGIVMDDKKRKERMPVTL
ncbi:MAG: Lrp/AsnC family transcriptional regulator [Lachnospiraceae bacterium]|nr:Lrp/AsnC family transcriptional regulator [Lachnospiraceae bacterium]